MSNSALSDTIRKRIIPFLEKELKNELNDLVQELEFDKSYMVPALMNEYKVTESEATEMYTFIVSDITSRSGKGKSFTRKRLKGKVVFSTFGSTAKVSAKGSAGQYGTFKDWKTKVSGLFETKFKLKDLRKSNKPAKEGENPRQLSRFLILGHGAGSAYSKVAYRSLNAAFSLLGDSANIKGPILGTISRAPLLHGFEIVADSKKAFKGEGEFKANYRVRLKMQTVDENVADSILEKALLAKNGWLIKELEKLAVDADSSPSSIKIVAKVLDDAILGKKSKGVSYKSKAIVLHKNKKKGRKGKKPARISPIRDPKGRFTSAANIQQIIQSQITEKVKENMGEGGSLVNRTGRFAESVALTNITQSRQGTLTAFYNYMKYPYQTFERGFKQGSTRRDPRLLISRSIREIAVTLISRKLNIKTRRV
jgi:hypothetical protein